MARRETCTFDKKHFYTQKDEADQKQYYRQYNCFHGAFC